jgi:hypothetical protein
MQMIAAIAAGALLASHPALSLAALVFTGIKTNANGCSVPPAITHAVQCVTKIAFNRAVAANSAKKARGHALEAADVPCHRQAVDTGLSEEGRGYSDD